MHVREKEVKKSTISPEMEDATLYLSSFLL